MDYIRLTNEIFLTVPLKYIGWPIKAGQIPQEIEALLKIVAELNVSRMLEIGSFNGGTLFLFSRMVNADAKIISLDLPGVQFGLGNEISSRLLFTNFATEYQTVYPLKGDSHLSTSLEKVKAILKGKKLDFIFLDGDHSYDGVKRDFEMYSPLVRRGGIVAFHDICEHPPEMGIEVHLFWNELKNRYEYKEIINEPDSQKWAGIGVVYL